MSWLSALVPVHLQRRVGEYHETLSDGVTLRVPAPFLLVLVGLVACDQPTAPSSSAPTHGSSPPAPPGSPPIPSGMHAIRGVVTERTPLGNQPFAGANVNAWVQANRVGYSYMWAHGPHLSDSQGRYELVGLPDGAVVQLQVYKEGYFQQCAAPSSVVTGDLFLDVQLVSRANVSASPSSVAPSPPGLRFISGSLYDVGADGRRAASGTFVDYEPIDDFPAALTVTDPQGRFLLCGIPQDRTASIASGIGGRVTYYPVPPGGDASVEIEIK